MSIKYLPHTADVRMEIEAKTIQDLFKLSIKGMGNILKNDVCDVNKDFDSKIQIQILSQDYTSLLIDFLSEVLSYSYINNNVYCTLNSIIINDYSIKSEVFGTYVDAFDEEIKAVTYHEANVLFDNVDKLWKTCVIFDI